MSTLKKLAISTVTAIGLLSASSTIASGYLVERLFYATSAKTQVVGERITRCDGATATWGTVTPYSRIVSMEPCGFNF